MINRKMILTKKEYDRMISELLYTSFKFKNEQRFRELSQPKMNQKSVNKMVSQKYQNISRKQRINKSAYICGKVKY